MSQVIALGPAARMLTTREAALRLGVSLRTVQLWVEASILPAARTPGGHRRIPYNAVEALAMNMGLADVAPPSALGKLQRRAGDGVLAELASGAGSKAQAANAPQASPAAKPADAPLKVVLVARDDEWLQACASALEVFGRSVDVHVADNGYVALLMIGREAPQLLVTTLELPGMDGVEMLRTLERCDVLSGLQVLTLMTPEATAQYVHETLPPGVEVMPLPVSPEALAIRVGRWLLARQTTNGGRHE
jgi:excisionase family DNA binding protein